MNSRNEILSRLKKSARLGASVTIKSWNDRDLYADYPMDLVPQFCDRLKNLSGEIHQVDSRLKAVELLKEFIPADQSVACAAHHFPLLDNLLRSDSTLAPAITFIDNQTLGSDDFARFEIGITAAEYLIARTGSIFLRTRFAGGRRLSVLPPTHIVLAGENQVVASLDEVLRRDDFAEENWSFATVITGPSRTSDIEKQLVLGAHGPKRLIVILLKNT